MREDMKKLVESMQSLPSDVLGMMKRPSVDSEEDIDGMGEAIGTSTFRSLLSKIFTDDMWDTFMEDMEERGLDSVQVQADIDGYFTHILKWYFAGEGIGTVTVQGAKIPPANTKKLAVVGEAISRKSLYDQRRFQRMFKKVFESKEFSKLMYRYGNDPRNPDSTMDEKRVSADLEGYFLGVMKALFGKGGKIKIGSIDDAVKEDNMSESSMYTIIKNMEKMMGEHSSDTDEDVTMDESISTDAMVYSPKTMSLLKRISTGAMDRLIDAMVYSPKTMSLLKRFGVDETNIDALKQHLIPAVSSFFAERGMGVAGIAGAKKALKNMAKL